MTRRGRASTCNMQKRGQRHCPLRPFLGKGGPEGIQPNGLYRAEKMPTVSLGQRKALPTQRPIAKFINGFVRYPLQFRRAVPRVNSGGARVPFRPRFRRQKFRLPL